MYMKSSFLKRVIICICCSLFMCVAAFSQPEPLTFRSKNNTADEMRTIELLKKLTKQYDLSKYLFTKKIVIDTDVIPHSHPELTLNTRHNLDEDLLLSTFIHEQLHWFVMSKEKTTRDSVLHQLQRIFPDPRLKYPFGSEDAYNTYMHIVICYLEIITMRKLVGELKAYQVLQFLMNDHYTWVYQHIHNRGFSIFRILKANGLLVE